MFEGQVCRGAMPERVGSWFCVAYRPAGHTQSGCVVISTGHPESQHQEFLQAMAAYALNHEYLVPRRPLVADESVQAVPGEDQVHYWNLVLPEAGNKLTVTFTGLADTSDLYVRRGLPPTPRKSDEKSVKARTGDERVVISNAKADEYWIGVMGRHLRAAGATYTLRASVE